jgi:hypothetical protein
MYEHFVPPGPFPDRLLRGLAIYLTPFLGLTPQALR